MKSAFIQKIIVFNLILLALLCHTCGMWQENELSMLQRAYVFSDSDSEREKIVDQLEDYFLKMTVQDSLERKLYCDVDILINEYNTETHSSLENYRDEPNIYHVESKFYDLLKSKIIAIAKQDKANFSSLDPVAEYLDSELGINYWKIYYKEVENYSSEQAKYWLLAQKASQECRLYSDSFNQIKTALIYAALGLRYLNYINDERIKMDIIQRVQYALYKYYGFYELSIALANRYLGQCDSIGYKLRANGLLFNIAIAYFESGKLTIALSKFKSLTTSLTQNNNVPYVDWYLNNSLLSIADIYTWSGNYADALAMCDTLENRGLSQSEKLSVRMIRGLIHRNLGNYETAEKNYNLALNIAKKNHDFENTIKLNNNFGFLFLKLSEYQKALQFFGYALKEIEMNSPDSYDLKSNLILNIANVYIITGNYDKADSILMEAQTILSKMGTNPKGEADLLNTLGKYQTDILQYVKAYSNLSKAESICDLNGLIKICLLVKLNLADNLIFQQKYKDAETKISEVLYIADQIMDVEKQIDAYAIMSRLKSIQGDNEQASHFSDSLISKIKQLSERFDDSQRLIAYQQKINDYLKAAVEYDIRLDRVYSAIIKLDFAKSLVFLQNNGLNKSYKILSVSEIEYIIKNLKPNLQIFDYMLTNNYLYTFVLNNSGIDLSVQNINYDSLKLEVSNYIQTINNTINIFKYYSPESVDEHFKKTSELAHNVYTALIGDRLHNIKSDSNFILYIIPDDYLHYIPFASLVVKNGEDPTFLIEEANIAYLPGLAINNTHLSSSDITESDNIFLASDPSIPNMNNFIEFLKKYNSETYILNSATSFNSKEELLTEIENMYDMYIFAGHSYANTQYQGTSYIEMTIPSEKQKVNHKFKLDMLDIMNVEWDNAKLIFLLGCETGSGSLYKGMGLSGLQSSFLLSGAKNVLANLWRIDAAQSINQATDFFRQYMQTNDLTISLRNTQINAIKKLKHDQYFRHAHPYFWGSFQISQNSY